jgi:hypothetical protein
LFFFDNFIFFFIPEIIYDRKSSEMASYTG